MVGCGASDIGVRMRAARWSSWSQMAPHSAGGSRKLIESNLPRPVRDHYDLLLARHLSRLDAGRHLLLLMLLLMMVVVLLLLLVVVVVVVVMLELVVGLLEPLVELMRLVEERLGGHWLGVGVGRRHEVGRPGGS